MPRPFLFLSVCGLAVAFVLSTVFFWYANDVAKRTEVVFLNVGEGDAILLSQGMNQVLIDGGRDGKTLLTHLGRHMPFWDRTIEAIIATHPDADHINGFQGVLRAYRVDRVLSTGSESDTETFRRFRDATITNVSASPLTVFRGTTIEFPHGGKLTVEYPNVPESGIRTETNEKSIVARFTYGETSILLTGDLPREEEFLSKDESRVTVLKVAHHGSKYSTSDAFLERIKPKEAVISVGKNSYGHPNEDVLERLAHRGITLFRTDILGDIVYRCVASRCVYEGS